MDMKGKRYYYFIRDNQVVKYPSVTTIISKAMYQDFKYLIETIVKYGVTRWDEYLDERRHYGTLMHILFSEYLTRGSLDSGTIPARIAQYKYDKRLKFDTYYWNDSLCNDLECWHQFCVAHSVRPLAVSLMLYSDDLRIAGEIDAIISMKIGTGVNGNILKADYKVNKNNEIEDKTQEIICIIDWKSGRHGFYNNNEAQLCFYKKMFVEHYPELHNVRIANWSPKEFESENATWAFKFQDDSIEQNKIGLYRQLFAVDESIEKPANVKQIQGVWKLGENNSSNVTFTPLEGLLISRKLHTTIDINNQDDKKELFNEINNVA